MIYQIASHTGAVVPWIKRTSKSKSDDRATTTKPRQTSIPKRFQC